MPPELCACVQCGVQTPVRHPAVAQRNTMRLRQVSDPTHTRRSLGRYSVAVLGVAATMAFGTFAVRTCQCWCRPPSTDVWSQHPQSDSKGPLAALWYLRYRGTDRLDAVSANISKHHAHLHSRARSSGHRNPWHVLQRAAGGPQAVELRECWPEGAPHVRNAVRLVHGHQAEVARCMQLLQLRICAGGEVLRCGVHVLKLP